MATTVTTFRQLRQACSSCLPIARGVPDGVSTSDQRFAVLSFSKEGNTPGKRDLVLQAMLSQIPPDPGTYVCNRAPSSRAGGVQQRSVGLG